MSVCDSTPLPECEAVIGNGYKCTFSFSDPACGGRGLLVEWEPREPDHLSRKMLERYRAARNSYLEELARIWGIKILLVEA